MFSDVGGGGDRLRNTLLDETFELQFSQLAAPDSGEVPTLYFGLFLVDAILGLHGGKEESEKGGYHASARRSCAFSRGSLLRAFGDLTCRSGVRALGTLRKGATIQRFLRASALSLFSGKFVREGSSSKGLTFISSRLRIRCRWRR